MKFTIKNYRAVKSAVIELSEKLTFIGGENGAGKTSLIDAIKCALTGIPNPFSDIPKKQSSRLVHSGAPCGMINFSSGKNEINIEYPEQKETIKGIVPNVSEFASGIKNLIELKPSERIEYICNVMKAYPTDIDLIAALKKTNIFPKASTIGTLKPFQNLWENITINGWDNAYNTVKTKGAELKGVWKHITGNETYGSKIAEMWYPDGWTHDLENKNIEILRKEYDNAKQKYSNVETKVNIDNMEKERLTTLVEQYDTYNAKREKMREKHKALEADRIELINTDRSEIRGLLCPKCQSKLTMTNGELKLIPEDSKLSDNKDKIKAIKKEQDELLMEFGEIRQVLNAIDEAKNTLSNISEDTNANIEKITEEYITAEKRLNCVLKYTEASKCNKQIINNKKIQEILSPLGLRAEILEKKISVLNNSAKLMSKYSDWGIVDVATDGNITYNGVPYGRLIAKSERYRVNIILQYMIVMAEKTPVVVIDDADELTGKTRNGLIKMIIKTGIKTIVACALKSREDLPDFTKFGGKSYWIENGIIE